MEAQRLHVDDENKPEMVEEYLKVEMVSRGGKTSGRDILVEVRGSSGNEKNGDGLNYIFCWLTTVSTVVL